MQYPTFVKRTETHDYTIIVRGSRHQAMFTSEREFLEWLDFECSRHSAWMQSPGSPHASCVVYYPEGVTAQRSIAHRISHMQD